MEVVANNIVNQGLDLNNDLTTSVKINDNLSTEGGTEFLQQVAEASNDPSLIGKFSGLIDQIQNNRSVLRNAIENKHSHSAHELQEIQTAASEFALSSQLLGRAVSTVVKGVDALVHIQ